MKKTICIVLLMAIATSSFSQDSNFPPVVKNKHYYKTKSSRPISSRVYFLGCWGNYVNIASTGNVDFDALGLLVVVGGLSTIVSIPLLIASARNKRKAKRATTFFRMETMPVIQQYSLLCIHSRLFQ